jgi:NSS family neurotransmitter:Na+ symporter
VVIVTGTDSTRRRPTPTSGALAAVAAVLAVGVVLTGVATVGAVAVVAAGAVALGAATLLLGRSRPPALTAGVFVLGSFSALSYSPLDLAIAGRPVLDLVDESVGTYALPISALLIAVVFVWAADLEAISVDLGPLYPIVRFVVPAVLVIVTGSKVAGVARRAWRLVLDRPPAGVFGFGLSIALFAVLAGVIWLYRGGRHSKPLSSLFDR